jgi:zinc protease
MVAGTPSAQSTVADLQKAVIEQIERLKTEPVTSEELDRIKVQVVANAVYERDSVFYQAMQIGMLETVGLDWRLSDQYVDNIKAVTAEQVQEVANKYFIDKGLTVAELIPQEMTTEKRVRSFGGRHGR